MIVHKRTSGVYSLTDPRSGRVMYVGQSVDVEYRYRQHLNSRHNRPMVEWVRGLDCLGLKPVLNILVECDYPESDAEERRLIREHKARGECEFNRAVGGSGAGVSKALNGHPDDWFQLGLKIKQARALLLEVVSDAQRLMGKSYSRGVVEAVRDLGRAKVLFEMTMRRTFPERDDVSKVFFGDNDDGF